MSGGEADVARLLGLARREISEAVLPQLAGDARYRLRLVLNALKLASAAIEDNGRSDAVRLEQLRRIVPENHAAEAGEIEAWLQAALRAGDLDASEALYQALVHIAEARETLVK